MQALKEARSPMNLGGRIAGHYFRGGQLLVGLLRTVRAVIRIGGENALPCSCRNLTSSMRPSAAARSGCVGIGQLADMREWLARLEASRDADRAQMQAELARFKIEIERAELRLTRLLPVRGEQSTPPGQEG